MAICGGRELLPNGWEQVVDAFTVYAPGKLREDVGEIGGRVPCGHAIADAEQLRNVGLFECLQLSDFTIRSIAA